jgi:hypothetical protein
MNLYVDCSFKAKRSPLPIYGDLRQEKLVFSLWALKILIFYLFHNVCTLPGKWGEWGGGRIKERLKGENSMQERREMGERERREMGERERGRRRGEENGGREGGGEGEEGGGINTPRNT